MSGLHNVVLKIADMVLHGPVCLISSPECWNERRVLSAAESLDGYRVSSAALGSRSFFVLMEDGNAGTGHRFRQVRV